MPPHPVYTVELPVYSGPLDLLLQLIEHAELDITKVSLLQVTDQYLEHLRQLDERDPASVADFLVIAAKLILIKSEALLPRPPVRQEGEEDPAEELARLLQAYRRYKEIAGLLNQRIEAGLRTYLRTAPPPKVAPRLDLSNVSTQDLMEAMKRATAGLPPQAPLEGVVRPYRVSIRAKIRLVVKVLQSGGRTSFTRLLEQARSRLEVIVTFLAVLELIKRRQVVARQEAMFGNIEIVPTETWDASAEFELEFGE